MPPLFKKLNLSVHTEIHVLNAPASFEPELALLDNVKVKRSLGKGAHTTFALAFAITQASLDSVSAALVDAAQGDAIVWIAYPKGTSKKYRCEFNRDSGWAVFKAAGFDTVRMVAIDEDWSALRFRSVQYIAPTRK
jgi:hypothetical protein